MRGESKQQNFMQDASKTGSAKLKDLNEHIGEKVVQAIGLMRVVGITNRTEIL